MILPYLAIALLILITVYSAIVSFRQNLEGAAPTWLFPGGANRVPRVLVAAVTIAGLIFAVIWVSTSAKSSTERSLRFLIPENYTGWVRVEFEVRGAPALPVEARQAVVKIPGSGLLRTSSAEQYGWAKDYYFFYSGAGVRPIPKSGPGRLIWGKINGEETGASGKRKYEQFFVGTEQQFRDRAGASFIFPNPDSDR
jgi:hypothetical protein